MKQVITLLFVVAACGADSLAKILLIACPACYYVLVACGAIMLIRLYVSICKEL